MHSIYKQGNLPYLNVKTCPNCEKLLPLNTATCPNCSHSFVAKTVVKPVVKEKKVEEVVKPVEPIYQSEVTQEQVEVKKEESKKFVFCDNCGAKIIGSQRYCGGCGAKVSKRICPSCDQIVDANLVFCPLCGERLQENSNVSAVDTHVTNQSVQPVQPVQQLYGQQPINIYLNPTTGQAVVSDHKPEEEVTSTIQTTQINESDVNYLEQQEEQVETKEEVKEIKEFEGINMGRKRLFLIIQLLFVGALAAIMVMVPLLTKESLLTSLIPCLTGTSSETMVSGKHIVAYVMEAISNKQPVLNSSSVIYPHVVNESGQALFTSMPFVQFILNLVSKNPEGLSASVSIVVVLLSYVLIALAMVISLLSGFVGMFVKKPYRGKTLGFLLVTLVIAALLIYTSTFFEAFAGYDCWLLYAFVIIFILWFIVKIVFTKEAKLYKQSKEK